MAQLRPATRSLSVIAPPPFTEDAHRTIMRSRLTNGVRSSADERAITGVAWSRERAKGAEQMDASMEQVKKLRDITGAGLLDCKKALAECGGNIDRAVKALKTKGLADLRKMEEATFLSSQILDELREESSPTPTKASSPTPAKASSPTPAKASSPKPATATCRAYVSGRCVVQGRDGGPCSSNPESWQSCSVVAQNSNPKVDRIEKWRKAERWDKITKALSHRDSTMRVAAAAALGHMDTSGHYGSKTTIDAAFNSLLRRLGDTDPTVVASAASSLAHFGRPAALKPLVAALDHSDDPAARFSLIEAIRSSFSITDVSAFNQSALATAQRLSEEPQLTSLTAEILLDMLARLYIANPLYPSYMVLPHPEDSPLGDALVSVGPAAGAALIKVAEGMSGPKAAAAAAFGASIVKGSACGGHHVLDSKCVCKKCGVTKHSFTGKSCVCTRCRTTEHDFRRTGGEMTMCLRCGERKSMYRD